jgi:hypothetical protein
MIKLDDARINVVVGGHSCMCMKEDGTHEINPFQLTISKGECKEWCCSTRPDSRRMFNFDGVTYPCFE